MAHSVDAVLDDLRTDNSYALAFERAFGTRSIRRRQPAQALAAFVRTLVDGGTPFDRNSSGSAAERGRALFEGRARCRFCHEGAQFTDGRFHNTGVGWGEEPLDLGRFEDAIEVLRFYCGLYPADANAFDSLGEAYHAAFRLREAIESYEHSLALDPGNDNAARALEELRSQVGEADESRSSGDL